MMKKQFIILPFIALLLIGCKHNTSEQLKPAAFDADSAFDYIETQVFFGPRVPQTATHMLCAKYLEVRLRQFGAKVRVEQGSLKNFADQEQQIYNIIGSFNPEAKQRILLCAHWDTRPWADQEEDYDKRTQPILGANDGASGVGVLLEIARQLGILQANQQLKESVGIDIVFFDCEDMGTPDFYVGNQRENTWCLGSQLWAKQHKKEYKYGILLDMVGSPDAVFPKEYFSMQHAENIVEKVWRNAQKLGYGRYFIDHMSYPITDDHYYVNTLAEIPCIDIIHYNPNSETGFAHYWHTTEDNMQNISPETLKAVGEVVLTTILN